MNGKALTWRQKILILAVFTAFMGLVGHFEQEPDEITTVNVTSNTNQP